MKNKIISVILTTIVIILAISASFEFVKMLKDFSISSRIELLFIIGFVLYLVIHLVLYKPVFMHVMSHELTHVLWAALFGGKAKKLEVSNQGGRVLISKTNFLISLAPYFFPLYTVILSLIYLIADEKFLPYIALFVGMSLAFHTALTLYSLKTNQSDFREDSNVVFSYAFVYFMNLIVFAMVFSMLSDKIRFVYFLKETFTGSYGIFIVIISKINEWLK